MTCFQGKSLLLCEENFVFEIWVFHFRQSVDGVVVVVCLAGDLEPLRVGLQVKNIASEFVTGALVRASVDKSTQIVLGSRF